jgi:antitoxin component of MazEF toxin-antitoxin module
MNKHTLSIQEDEDGELFFEIPPQILGKLNWQEGDAIEFIEHSEGLMLRKYETNTDSKQQ